MLFLTKATVLGLLTVSGINAAPAYWCKWTSSTTVNNVVTVFGHITTPTATVQVTYTNPQGVSFLNLNGIGTNYWDYHQDPVTLGTNSPYISPEVDNGPPDSDILALRYAGPQTLSFDQAIANPVFAFVSMNGNGYGFDQDFTIVSQNSMNGAGCGHWGCGQAERVIANGEFQLDAKNLDISTEPHGVLRFNGKFSQVNWRSLSNENWNGFQVGIQEIASVVFGDPQFAGFQGQSFQFHGLADEVFNLISTPSLQVNGHFVYLSSGNCDYNNTVCFQHPGTYIDQLGFAFQGREVTLVAGSHVRGMNVHINGEMISGTGRYVFTGKDGHTVIVHIRAHDRVTIQTEQFHITVINSDMFFNIESSLLDRHVLRLGSKRHTITDHSLCQQDTKHAHGSNTTEHQHGAMEAVLQQKYGGVQVPLHGLIGQTWRNAVVCGREWVGSVEDYVASDLFATDYFFNFYTQSQEE